MGSQSWLLNEPYAIYLQWLSNIVKSGRDIDDTATVILPDKEGNTRHELVVAAHVEVSLKGSFTGIVATNSVYLNNCIMVQSMREESI